LVTGLVSTKYDEYRRFPEGFAIVPGGPFFKVFLSTGEGFSVLQTHYVRTQSGWKSSSSLTTEDYIEVLLPTVTEEHLRLQDGDLQLDQIHRKKLVRIVEIASAVRDPLESLYPEPQPTQPPVSVPCVCIFTSDCGTFYTALLQEIT
jgi:hypothetical protein